MDLDTYTTELARTRRQMNGVRAIGLVCVIAMLGAYLLHFHVVAVMGAVGLALIVALCLGVPLQMRAYRLRKAIAAPAYGQH